MEEREAYIGFSAFPGVGPQRFKLLTEYFGSAVSAWTASEKTLKEIGLGDKLTVKLVDFRRNFDVGTYTHTLLTQEITIVTRIDNAYPQRLKEIPDPPISLFIKGTLPKKESILFAVVGTRKPTSYGVQITQSLSRDLVSSGCVIVSGLARGVDGIAHRAAVELGGKTVAVLGCGVDIVYPPEHKNLYQEILAHCGAVISEVPPGHTVIKGLFPARNRIISGLSQGVLVTEGAQDSGSLITAQYAAEQGRDVFAVPGPITSYLSAGPTKLIQQGAKLVTAADDILEELKIPQSQLNVKSRLPDLHSDEENKVLNLLTRGECLFDDLARDCGFSVSKLGVLLTKLELEGTIRSLGNGKYGIF